MVDGIARQITGNATFAKIADDPNPENSVNYGEKSVDRLLSLTNYVRYIGVALVGLLIFIALVFINNTIRLAILARRKEIAIMRLVGASNGFIRGPFLMEGALHAIIGSLLAVGSIEPYSPAGFAACFHGACLAAHRTAHYDVSHYLRCADCCRFAYRGHRLVYGYAPLPEGLEAGFNV